MDKNTNQQQVYKLIPNSERVIVKLIPFKADMAANILIPGQLKAGENLYMGAVVSVCDSWYDEKGNKHDAKYKSGQLVYYSEYSAAALFQLHRVVAGEWTYGEMMNEKNRLFVVSEDDIMAMVEGVEGGIAIVNKPTTGIEDQQKEFQKLSHKHDAK